MSLIVGGLTGENNTANLCAGALGRMCQVVQFDIRNACQWKGLRQTMLKIPRGIPTSLSGLSLRYPDMQAYFQVDECTRRTIWPMMTMKKIPTALWAIDTHTMTHFFLRSIVRDFDFVFVAQRDHVEEYNRLHGNAHWLPLCCEPAVHRDLGLTRDIDIAFVGNLGPMHLDRRRLIERLRSRFNLEVFSGLYGDEMSRVFSRSKIVFNRSVRNDLNFRVFEAMACRSLVLTDDIENGLRTLFEPDRHLVVYNEFDLEDKLEYYLTHDDERVRIAQAGENYVTRYHTYDVRMKTVLLALGLLEPLQNQDVKQNPDPREFQHS